MSSCIVNLGLYRTGTTTLAEAARHLQFNVYRQFPLLPCNTLKVFLSESLDEIDKLLNAQMDHLVDIVSTNDFVCDGFFPLFALASPKYIELFKIKAKERGVHLTFIATQRIDFDSYLRSELHHWVLNDLERRTNLGDDRSNLERLLKSRYDRHKVGITNIKDPAISILELNNIGLKWANVLSQISRPSEFEWSKALLKVGKQNSSPGLPLQAILLTMRVVHNFDHKLKGIEFLLEDIESDHLCSYILVLAIDEDEYESQEALRLQSFLANRKRLNGFHCIKNPRRGENEPVAICNIWHNMAICAWRNDASWVVFLGDDVRIMCNHHYRSIYRSFLDIHEKLKLTSAEMFGSPWLDDNGFKNFPTFPIVGNAHFRIFQGLIPEKYLKKNFFVNQDLDPFLQRLYLKFGAAPLLKNVNLLNTCGGSENTNARYKRIPARHWREEVLNDVLPIRTYLEDHNCCAAEHMKTILDVIIPSYRVNIEYLERICSLKVPSYMRTTFIVIVDNPEYLVELTMAKLSDKSSIKRSEAELLLEDYLCSKSNHINNIRVRCNEDNIGASASRNRGIDESSAEYLLFLDDDVIPDENILEEYGSALKKYSTGEESLLGLVGIVEFPRTTNLPILHGGILMSYLTFMFEISKNPSYEKPSWGVTANILYKKFPGMFFDTSYAKTGGGEDVDFALRLFQEHGVKLRSCPSAKVHHPFWNGGFHSLCAHFFCWAIGDGSLFYRFPNFCYHSFPNFVEIWVFLLFPSSLATANAFYNLCILTLITFLVDTAIDMCWKWGKEFNHRRALLKHDFSIVYIMMAHILASIYIVVLESGRLFGHIKRGQAKNITRRFDWHCDSLPASKENFIQREKFKFLAHLLILMIYSWYFTCPSRRRG